MADEPEEYGLVMPFWIDTPAYSQRDKEMFVCGVEFQMVCDQFRDGWHGTRPIHRENESRLRMAANKLGRRVIVSQHEGYEGCETWSQLETTD